MCIWQYSIKNPALPDWIKLNQNSCELFFHCVAMLLFLGLSSLETMSQQRHIVQQYAAKTSPMHAYQRHQLWIQSQYDVRHLQYSEPSLPLHLRYHPTLHHAHGLFHTQHYERDVRLCCVLFVAVILSSDDRKNLNQHHQSNIAFIMLRMK